MSGEEGELYNKVYTKCVLLRVWDPERVQFTYQSLPYQLHSEAEVIGTDILSNVSRHLRPLVVPRD